MAEACIPIPLDPIEEQEITPAIVPKRTRSKKTGTANLVNSTVDQSNKVVELFPDLRDWEPEPGEEYYVYENDVVKARYDKLFRCKETDLQIFYIEKAHYKTRMPDIIRHLNYFLTYFDTERSSFLSILSLKYQIDIKKDMSIDSFINLMLTRVITKKFISDCKRMAKYLYRLNVNTDPEGKYKTSPKITNDQARQLVALSFCYRIILPICIHFSNVSTSFIYIDEKSGKEKRDSYLKCFMKLFGKIMQKFEENDVKVYVTLCKFINHRSEKEAQQNKTIFAQKEMLRGDVIELYTENIIREVILVKSLYKLEYYRSCVSFLDGITNIYGRNYRNENYTSKPQEIDSPDSKMDNDDRPSHAEAIEMSVYKIDESNAIINDVNRLHVLESMRPHLQTLGVDHCSDEFTFYLNHVRGSEVSDLLMHAFYSGTFHDPHAIYNLSRPEYMEWLIYMKKFLDMHGLKYLAQMCTANVRAYYKENSVKNARFAAEIESSPVYQQVVSTKFKYLLELEASSDGQQKNSDPILRKFLSIINCSYECVDYNPEINGYVIDDINITQIIYEFMTFLTII